MLISVIGGSQCTEEEAKLAEAVGRGLATRGHILVCGGLGGVMEAACRGAREAGGTTVGILPSTSRQDANPYVDIPIVTGLGHARNAVVVNSGAAVIAIGGSYGTLSEIGLARAASIPVVGLKTWHLRRQGEEKGAIIRARTAAEAVDKALALAQKAPRRNQKGVR